jgi:hypothetical protein
MNSTDKCHSFFSSIATKDRGTSWRQLMLTACFCMIAAPAAVAIEAGMPNPPARPTRVRCGLMILDVVGINDVEETFEAEVALVASWKDPRLAFDPEAEGTDQKIFQGDFQFAEIFTGWWPQLLIINQVGSGDTNAIKVEINPDGQVTLLEQRNVLLETPMSLYDYPFDTQRLRAVMVPFGNTSDEVILEVDERYIQAANDYVRREQGVNVAGWDLREIVMKADETELNLTGTPTTFSRVVTTIMLKRQNGQIIWNILFPLLVLVSMVWSIFWLDCDSLSDRLNISFIGVLTIVAYQFVVIDHMPRMSYLTFTDTLLLGSFLITTATIVQSLFLGSLIRHGQRERADRIDWHCRWIFPLCYILMIAGQYTASILF